MWYNSRRMRIPNTTWSWLAALIDGEGCIMITRRCPSSKSNQKISKQPHYRCQVAVANTNKLLLETISERVGFGKIYHHKRPEHKNHAKLQYTWRMNSTECLKYLPKILPWLVIKKEQAEVLLRVIKIAQLNTPTRGISFNWEEVRVRLEVRDKLYLRMRELNQKGREICLSP